MKIQLEDKFKVIPCVSGIELYIPLVIKTVIRKYIIINEIFPGNKKSNISIQLKDGDNNVSLPTTILNKEQNIDYFLCVFIPEDEINKNFSIKFSVNEGIEINYKINYKWNKNTKEIKVLNVELIKDKRIYFSLITILLLIIILNIWNWLNADAYRVSNLLSPTFFGVYIGFIYIVFGLNGKLLYSIAKNYNSIGYILTHPVYYFKPLLSRILIKIPFIIGLILFTIIITLILGLYLRPLELPKDTDYKFYLNDKKFTNSKIYYKDICKIKVSLLSPCITDSTKLIYIGHLYTESIFSSEIKIKTFNYKFYNKCDYTPAIIKNYSSIICHHVDKKDSLVFHKLQGIENGLIYDKNDTSFCLPKIILSSKAKTFDPENFKQILEEALPIEVSNVNFYSKKTYELNKIIDSLYYDFEKILHIDEKMMSQPTSADIINIYNLIVHEINSWDKNKPFFVGNNVTTYRKLIQCYFLFRYSSKFKTVNYDELLVLINDFNTYIYSAYDNVTLMPKKKKKTPRGFNDINQNILKLYSFLLCYIQSPKYSNMNNLFLNTLIKSINNSSKNAKNAYGLTDDEKEKLILNEKSQRVLFLRYMFVDLAYFNIDFKNDEVINFTRIYYDAFKGQKDLLIYIDKTNQPYRNFILGIKD